jgi:hypothetical protein
MGDIALDITTDPLAIEGFEHVLESDDVTVSDSPQTTRTMSDTVGQVVGEKVSITEAAIRLGVSERTIQRRITRGQLLTEKDAAGRVYVVVCPTQSDTVSVSVSQSSNIDGQQSDTVGQNESKSDQDQLWEMVRAQATKIEALTARNGWLESQLHERQEDIKELKLLTDSQHKRGWWARFGSWFMTGR